MDYIYDIILNFQDKYYDFYEWYPTDRIINVKKIPIYKITNKDYLSIKNNETIIDKASLPQKNKMFLLACDYEIMGILINNNGLVIKKSSLIFEESDDILLSVDDIKKINIRYQVTKKNRVIYTSRITYDNYNYVTKYLNSLDKNKDKYLLKYLYFDIYNTEEDSIETIYNHLLSLASTNILKIYSAIKELNKIFNK